MKLPVLRAIRGVWRTNCPPYPFAHFIGDLVHASRETRAREAASKLEDGDRPSLAYALIVLTALAMGVRNAVVRKLAVADITTTVLTLTITGLAGDAPFVGGQGTRSGRKALSILLMFAGALIGTVLLLNWGFIIPLALSALLAVVVTIAALRNAAKV